jgi:23S rRNA (adenine2503-C2)-methyltransferase
VSGEAAAEREHLRNHTPESLAAFWPDLALRPEVARRILTRLVADDRDDLDSIRGLGRVAREALDTRGRTTRLRVVDRRRSAVDPFVKYLLEAPDGRLVETVRIPLDRPRWSACLSSQVGCAFRCAFCETGRLGFVRNLEPWEMVEQALVVRREAPERPLTGIVFQGQGEPLHNYASVLRAAYILRDPSGGRIAADRISICTSGLVPEIERFTDEGHPFRLIVSLTSAFELKRASLMPVTHRHPIPRLVAALTRHVRARGGVANVAWVTIAGFNTGEDEARELARLFAGVPLRVSVIDVMDASSRYRPPDDAERRRFLSALSDNGIGFVRRYSGGADIHAACGMLAAQARGGVPLGPTEALTALGGGSRVAARDHEEGHD